MITDEEYEQSAEGRLPDDHDHRARPPLPGEGEAFVVEEYTTREEWLAARHNGIGGSDAPAVWADLVPDEERRVTPTKVYYEKRGLVPPRDERGKDWLRIGSKVERFIAEMYGDETGQPLVYPGPYAILRSTRYPKLCVSVDRIIATARPGVLEAKNRFVGESKKWRESIPFDVAAQVQHAMLVTGYDWAAAAALIGGSEFRWCQVERDEPFLEEHLERVMLLVLAIERGEPPPVDGHRETSETLRAVYAHAVDGKAKDLGVEGEARVRAWQEARDERLAAEKLEAAEENWLVQAMGDAVYGNAPGLAAEGKCFRLAVEKRKPQCCKSCGAEVRAGSAPRVARVVKLPKEKRKP